MIINRVFSSFSTDNIAKAKAFYGETLGLNVEETPEGLMIKLPESDLFIYPKENHEPATFTVLNFAVESVDDAVDELISKGIKMEHYDMEYMKTDVKGIMRGEKEMPGPMAMAWFKDPAGNILSVLEE